MMRELKENGIFKSAKLQTKSTKPEIDRDRFLTILDCSIFYMVDVIYVKAIGEAISFLF